MGGHGPRPKAPEERVTRHEPQRGEVRTAEGVGWQHGRRPAAPAGLGPEARKAWGVWMGSWYASFWTPEDLPGLEVVARLYDAVASGELTRATEYRLQADTYGITPKGQQDRRWRAPYQLPARAAPAAPKASRYEHLSVVDETG